MRVLSMQNNIKLQTSVVCECVNIRYEYRWKYWCHKHCSRVLFTILSLVTKGGMKRFICLFQSQSVYVN